MTMGRIKNKNGFTLAEILVVSSILIILSMIMLSFFIQNTTLWQSITNQSDLRSADRNAMNYMTQELRKTTRTSTETPSPNLSIQSKPNNHSIDFYLPVDVDNNGFIFNSIGATEWDNNNKIQYQYVPGQKRLRRLEKGNQYVIANDVALIEFEDNSINSALHKDELKIILTLERLIQGKAVSVTLVSIVKLRNK
jgi:prepilin-type N-terminal cleavage/methylation domain-containing protein